jgi:pyrroline-5-carboxylate reductase
MKQKSALSGLKIAVLGCGNMGRALVRGLVEKSVYPQNISVFDVDKKKLEAIKKETSVKVAKSNRLCATLADIVILAVKPQILQEVIEDISTVVGKDALVLSIAAGVPIARLEQFFKKPICLVRAMPNMPALVGCGMSAFSPGRHAEARHRRSTEAVLSSLGEVAQVPEKWLDLVTAISGSGPAYFFLLAEKMIEAAYEMGMKVDLAKKLVYQTALGGGRVMTQTQEDPEVLIERVASKGGTTEAALKVFQKKGFGKIVQDAVKAAYRRSIELRK